MKQSSCAVALVAALAFSSSVLAQATGPDVIVGDLTGPSNYASDDAGRTSAFAIGTTSCNVGDAQLLWIANNNQHPVIGQNIYRVKDGVFEMIGVSWLKHGFTALQQNLCSPCTSSGTGARLGVGCSDPYSSGLNGQQGGLGPRWEVNAATGAFLYPYTSPAFTGNDRRIRVVSTMLDPVLNPGARFFGEAQYVSPDDAAAGNKNNNASWREMRVTASNANGSFNLGYTGSTVRTQPAILAWPVASQTAQVVHQDISNDGRVYLGFNVVAGSNGRNRYIYAIHNLNSDRAVGGISIAMPSGFSATGNEFRNVPWHSGELFQATAWNYSTSSNAVAWNTPTPFANDQWGSAVRWGSTFTFIFESEQEPGDVTLTLFKPGTPTDITFPAFSIPQPSWESNDAASSLAFNGGSNDPFVGPIRTTVAFGETVNVGIDGLANNLYQIFVTPGAGVPSGLLTAGEQIINIDLQAPILEFFPGFQTMPAGGYTLPLLAPNAAIDVTSQMAVINPASIDGFSASAANELSVRPLPRVVISATGADSFNNSTNDGFFKFQRVRAGGSAPVRVTMNLSAGRVFDMDQNQMNGTFWCGATGGTYRNNSAVTTGLVFDALNYVAACGNSGFIAIGYSATGNTCTGATFRFTGFDAGETFEFDADTDPSGPITGGAHAGTQIEVEFADGTTATGVLVADPNNAQRSFLEIF